MKYGLKKSRLLILSRVLHKTDYLDHYKSQGKVIQIDFLDVSLELRKTADSLLALVAASTVYQMETAVYPQTFVIDV